MSFNALSALGAGSPFYEVFQQDAPVAGRAERLADIRSAVVARNETVPTVNLFIDATSPKYEYAASIIDVCVERTTYAMHCTTGPAGVGSGTCGPQAEIITLIEGPSTYVWSTATSTHTQGVDVVATLLENCNLQGTTAAVCSPTIAGSADKTSTTTSSIVTVTGTDYYRFDVAITGGAEKTASPTACAGSGKSGAASLSTKAVAIWSLVGAIGVAGFLGC